jgi:hypothetical protein
MIAHVAGTRHADRADQPPHGVDEDGRIVS